MRDKSSLHYFEVHAGFVHHTVNANDYTRAEVPGIIRSIYAYHTQSKGWSDVGYNFLVDRFGRIWEGRYGGIDRPVVGAHTLGYNDYSFAMSAIGNFDITQPPAAMVQAYGALFAWKLSLHGVDASSTSQWVGSKDFQAINGHRDAGPDRLPRPVPLRQDPRDPEARRRGAARLGGPRARVQPRRPPPHPDLVVRRASDGQGFIIPTGGLTRFTAADGRRRSPPADRDGGLTRPHRRRPGRPGSSGQRRQPARSTPATAPAASAPRSRTADRSPATTCSPPSATSTATGATTWSRGGPPTAASTLYLGNGAGGFVRRRARHRLGRLRRHRRDRRPRRRRPRRPAGPRRRRSPVALPGAGGRRLLAPVALPGAWGGYATITGFGDFTSDGRARPARRRSAGEPGVVRPALARRHLRAPVGRGDPGCAAPPRSTRGQPDRQRAPPTCSARRGGRLVTYANAGTFELGAPDRHRRRPVRRRTWCSTPATGTATASATSSPAARRAASCTCAAATAAASSARR